MTIYPAIDILNGKCVRLLKGDFAQETVYAENPMEIARQFKEAGAQFIHIVDLDAARTGVTTNLDKIREIIGELQMNVQTGGGIRTLADVKSRMEAGVRRAIIGTAAVKNPEMVKEAVALYGDRIAVGIDAKDGMVAVSGWEEISAIPAEELILKMKEYGVQTIIYTDIDTDGMMSGTNVAGLERMIQISGLDIIASGGVSSMEDLQAVSAAGAEGAIIGQALYKGALQLPEVLEEFGGKV